MQTNKKPTTFKNLERIPSTTTNSNNPFNSARGELGKTTNYKTIETASSNYFIKSQGKTKILTNTRNSNTNSHNDMLNINTKSGVKPTSNQKISVVVDNTFIKKFPQKKQPTNNYNTIEATSINNQSSSATENILIHSNSNKLNKIIPQTTTNSNTYMKSPIFNNSINVNLSNLSNVNKNITATPTNTTKHNFFNNMLSNNDTIKKTIITNSIAASQARTRTINFNNTKNQIKYTTLKDLTHNSNSQSGSLSKDSTGGKYIKSSLSKATNKISNLYIKNSNSVSPSCSISNTNKVVEECEADKRKKNSIFKISIEKTLMNSHSQLVNTGIFNSSSTKPAYSSILNNLTGNQSKESSIDDYSRNSIGQQSANKQIFTMFFSSTDNMSNVTKENKEKIKMLLVINNASSGNKKLDYCIENSKLKYIHLIMTFKLWKVFVNRKQYESKRLRTSSKLTFLNSNECCNILQCYNNNILSKYDNDSTIYNSISNKPMNSQSIINKIISIKDNIIDEVRNDITEITKLADTLKSNNKLMVDYLQNKLKTKKNIQPIVNSLINDYNKNIKLIHYLTISSFFIKSNDLSIIFQQILTKRITYQVSFIIDNDNKIQQDPNTNEFIKKIEEILQIYLNSMFVKSSCLSLIRDSLEKSSYFVNKDKSIKNLMFFKYDNLFRYYKDTVISILKNKTLRHLKSHMDFINGSKNITKLANSLSIIVNIQSSSDTMNYLELADSLILQNKEKIECIKEDVDKIFQLNTQGLIEQINGKLSSSNNKIVNLIKNQIQPMIESILSYSQSVINEEAEYLNLLSIDENIDKILMLHGKLINQNDLYSLIFDKGVYNQIIQIKDVIKKRQSLLNSSINKTISKESLSLKVQEIDKKLKENNDIVIIKKELSLLILQWNVFYKTNISFDSNINESEVQSASINKLICQFNDKNNKPAILSNDVPIQEDINAIIDTLILNHNQFVSNRTFSEQVALLLLKIRSTKLAYSKDKLKELLKISNDEKVMYKYQDYIISIIQKELLSIEISTLTLDNIDSIISTIVNTENELSTHYIYISNNLSNSTQSTTMMFTKDEIIKSKPLLDSLVLLFNSLSDISLLLKEYLINKQMINCLSSQKQLNFNEDKAISYIVKSIRQVADGNLSNINDIVTNISTTIKEIKVLLTIKNDYKKRIKERYSKLFFFSDDTLISFIQWNLDFIKKANKTITKADLTKFNYYYYLLNNNYITISNKSSTYYIIGIHSSKHKFINFQNKLELNKLLTSSTDMLSVYNKIDQELKYSLKCEIVNSLNNFPKTNFFDWIFSSSIQVSICNMNLIFSNEISQILLNTSNNEEDEDSEETDKNNGSVLNRAEKLKSVKKPKKNEEGAVIKNDLEALLFKYQAWIEMLFKRIYSKDKESTLNQNIVKSMTSVVGSIMYDDFNNKDNVKDNKEIVSFTEYFKQNIINILITLNNHRNILQQLISSNIIEVESYDWLKFIRHLWDDEKKDVIVECGGWSIYQQYNFIPMQRIILTPQTEKVFLFAASCFREKSASVVKTTFNSYSYYNIFEEFSNNFWITLNKVNIIDSPSYITQIKDIFDCNTINKSWIFLENIDFLSAETVKSLSKLMQIIQQEIILNEIKQTSTNSSKSQKMFCLFACLKVESNYKLKEAYLKSSSRIMNLTKPDIDLFIKNLLEISGYVSIDYSSVNYKQGELLKNIFSIIINTTEKLISSQDANFYYDFYTVYSLQNYFIVKIMNYLALNVQVISTKYALIRHLVEFLMDYMRNLGYYSDEEVSNSLTLAVKQNINALSYGNNDMNLIKEEINNGVSQNIGNSTLINSFKSFYDTSGYVLNDSLVSSFSSLYHNISNSFNKLPIIYGNRLSGKSLFINNSLSVMQSINQIIKVHTIQDHTNISQYIVSNDCINYYTIERVSSITSTSFLTDIKPIIHKYSLSSSNTYSNNIIKPHRFIIELDCLKSFSHTDLTFYQLINIQQPIGKKLIKSLFNRLSSIMKGYNHIINDETISTMTDLSLKLIYAIEEDKSNNTLVISFVKIYNIMLVLVENLNKDNLNQKNILFNMIIQSLILISKAKHNLINIIKENSKSLKNDITNNFLSCANFENASAFDFYLDQKTLQFKLFKEANINKNYSLLKYFIDLQINNKNMKISIIGKSNYLKSEMIKQYLSSYDYSVYSSSNSNSSKIIYIDDLNDNSRLFFNKSKSNQIILESNDYSQSDLNQCNSYVVSYTQDEITHIYKKILTNEYTLISDIDKGSIIKNMISLYMSKTKLFEDFYDLHILKRLKSYLKINNQRLIFSLLFQINNEKLLKNKEISSYYSENTTSLATLLSILLLENTCNRVIVCNTLLIRLFLDSLLLSNSNTLFNLSISYNSHEKNINSDINIIFADDFNYNFKGNDKRVIIITNELTSKKLPSDYDIVNLNSNSLYNLEPMTDTLIKQSFHMRLSFINSTYLKESKLSISEKESYFILDTIANSIISSRESFLSLNDFTKNTLISPLLIDTKNKLKSSKNDISLMISLLLHKITSNILDFNKKQNDLNIITNKLSFNNILSYSITLALLLSEQYLIDIMFFEDINEVNSLINSLNQVISKNTHFKVELSPFYIDDFLIEKKLLFNSFNCCQYTLTKKINIVKDYLLNRNQSVDSLTRSIKESMFNNTNIQLPLIITSQLDTHSFNSFMDFISKSSKLTKMQETSIIINSQIKLYSSTCLQNNRLYTEISNILSCALKQYSHLIDYNELVNSESFFLEEFKSNFEEKSSINLKPDYYINLILEKLFLGINNKFLLAILITMQIMRESMEITEEEINLIVYLLRSNFRIKDDSSIKMRSKSETGENITSSMKNIHNSIKYSNTSNSHHSINNTINSIDEIPIIERQKIQAKTLIKMYKSDTLSLDDELLISQSFVELIESLVNQNQILNNNKKQISQIPSILTNNHQTSSNYLNIFRKQLTKDSFKIIFSLIFCEEESPSFFKYLINKYLKPIHAIDQYKINNLLKKQLSIPITIKSDNAINVTNFLCSLAAYYEIEFFIIRQVNFNPSTNNSKLLYDYNYIIDSNVYNFINEGITNGYWMLLTTDITFTQFTKILSLVKSKEKLAHNNFKLFIDVNVINQYKGREAIEFKTLLENYTLMLQVDSGSVDDLEAAHDIWVNVLEENILNKTLMDETQKEFLNLNNNFKHHEISAVSKLMKKINNVSVSNASNRSEVNELGEIHRHLNNIKFN